MSKELEAFVIVKNTLIEYPDDSAIYEVQNKSLDTIEKGLKALEIIKEYFILTSEYGKISLEPRKIIPEDKLIELKEALK